MLSSTAAPELSAGPSMSRGVGLRGFVDKWTEPLWGKPTWSPLIFYFKISQSLLGSCNGKKKKKSVFCSTLSHPRSFTWGCGKGGHFLRPRTSSIEGRGQAYCSCTVVCLEMWLPLGLGVTIRSHRWSAPCTLPQPSHPMIEFLSCCTNTLILQESKESGPSVSSVIRL